jgi:hypothetical protein
MSHPSPKVVLDVPDVLVLIGSAAPGGAGEYIINIQIERLKGNRKYKIKDKRAMYGG